MSFLTVASAIQSALSPSTWQPKDTFTLTLSILGVIISLITLYLTVLRPPSIKVFLGDFLIMRLTWDDLLMIAPEVGLYNAGAKVGTVFKISGSFTSQNSERSIQLRWKEVWKVENIAGPGERTLRWWSFVSFPELIVIPRAETALRRIVLVTNAPFKLLPGPYELKLDASSGGRSQDVFSISREVRITEADADWLDSHKPKTKDESGEHLHLSYDFKAGQYLRAI